MFLKGKLRLGLFLFIIKLSCCLLSCETNFNEVEGVKGSSLKKKEDYFDFKVEKFGEYRCHNFSFVSMGTLWRIIYCFDRVSIFHESLKASLISVASKYDETFSNWSEESELKKLEKKGYSSKLCASPLFISALSLANTLYLTTNKAFDVSLSSGNFSSLVFLKEKNCFAFSKEAPKSLTFNGIVKGMAVGEMAILLVNSGLNNFYINAGNGNLAFRITKEYLTQFKLDPSFFPMGYEKVYFLSQSKTTQKHDGQTHQHIYDPKEISQYLESEEKVICYSSLREKQEWMKLAGISDALSTALTVDPTVKIPSYCFRL